MAFALPCSHLLHPVLFGRPIVPHFEVKQSGESIINANRGLDYEVYVNEARGVLRSLICALSEHITPASSSSRSSSRAAKRKLAKHKPDDPPPFAKDVWAERLSKAVMRAQSWVNGRPIKGLHQPHCDAVSVYWSSLPYFAVSHKFCVCVFIICHQ